MINLKEEARDHICGDSMQAGGKGCTDREKGLPFVCREELVGPSQVRERRS